MHHRLDAYDIKILQILQQQGRITKSALAKAIHLSVTPCWERVKRLESLGIIEGYGARINVEALFKHTVVLLEVSLKQHHAQAFEQFEQAMQQANEVVECYATGGGVDYIVKVTCRDIEQYQALIDTWLDADIGIERYFTYIVTKTVKQCLASDPRLADLPTP